MLSRVVLAGNSTVASEHPLASLAGYDVLRNGGNAFDAAVATSFTLSVTMHHLGGLGGDFFGMFFEAKSGKVRCLNSSGWAPSGLTLDLVKSKGEKQVPVFGPLSCVIPGQIAGVWAMHKKLGRKEWRPLLDAAKNFAFKGFLATEGYSRSTAIALPEFSPEARQVFAPKGVPPSPGTVIRQENLGRLVSEIAEGGEEVFYRGWPADEIQEVLKEKGVRTDPSDLHDFRPEWVDPLALDYRGTTVYETPPNSIGPTTLLMLRILSEQQISKFGPLSKERMELTLRAAEVAYERKDAMLCDPRFNHIDIDAFMNTSMGKGHYGGRISEGDTTAFSVADGEGNLVSGIQSLFRHFGSRVFVPRCGIMLNDRASGFRLEGPNKVAPRKRPLHTLSSVILRQASSRNIALGTSGGDYRPLQHTLLINNLVDFEMPIEKAIDHPRFLWSEGKELMVETGFEEFDSPQYHVQRLQMPGHTGVCQAIDVQGRTQRAVCDVRGDGIPVGF